MEITMKTTSRKLWNLIIVLTMLLAMLPVQPVSAADETLGGTAAEGNLKIEVRETGGIGVARYTNSEWRTQVYVDAGFGEESAKGSRLEHDGAPSGYKFWDNNFTYGGVAGAAPTIVSNTKLDMETVQTVWTVPSARITQTVSYIDGTDYIHYVWQIENTGGAALTGVKFLHAADTCISGPDSDSEETYCDFMSDFGDGFWVASNQAVGVRQVDGSDEIRLYFQGVTAPAAYDSCHTSDTISNFSDGQLQDGLEDDQDHGYGLQWDNASLAAGDVWTIEAYERFMLPPAAGDVIVSAPAETTIGEGGAGDAVYTVSNLGGSAANVTFSTGTDPAGWSATVTDPASGSAAIPAGGEVSVTVKIEPTGSSEGDSGTVTLNANDGTNTSSDTGQVQVTAGGPAGPAAPTVTTPISGTTTSDATPTFTGTGEAGGTINVYDESDTVVCTTTVAGDGSWSCTPSSALTEGEQTYEVTVTDGESNESDPTPVTLNVDTTAPAAPNVTSPISGTTTSDATPTFTGTGEAGGEVNVYDDGGSVVCTTTVAGDGSWSCTPSSPLDEGEQTYDVTVTDEAGNESDPTPVTLDVDTTAPAAPTVTSPISGTAVMTDTPTFAGTSGEPGGEVNVYDDGGAIVCTTTVAGDGSWSCTPSSPLDEGEQTYDVTVTDDVGNESDPTEVTLDVDTTAPGAPTVTSPISGTAVMTDTPTFAGTGEAGGEVNVYDNGGNVVCSTTVAGDGSWSCTPSSPLDEGEQTYEVTVTDEVGNESDPTPVTLDVDTTAPTAPTVTAPVSGTVTGGTPTFTGTGEAGGEVNVYDDGGNVVCTATVAGDGSWSCTPSSPLDEGEQTYDVTVTDEAGNESDPTPVTLDVDTTAPTAPTVTSPISGTAVMTDTPTFAGTSGEPGGKVNVYGEGGNVVCTTTVAGDGSWSCTPSSPLDEREQTYDVTVTDDVGNESDPTEVTLDVDTTAPGAPTVTSPISGTAVMTDTPTFAGTGEAGGEVTITDEGGSTVCTTTVTGDGSWSCPPSSPLDEGEQTYEVTITDEAGNESDPTPVTLDVDTTAPAAPTVTAPVSGTVTGGTPTFEGTGEAGGEVTITDDGGNVICTTTVAQDGSWSCTPSSPLDEGEQTYDVTVTDEAGNESDPTPVTLDVDTTAPDAPTVTSPISGTAVMTDTPTFAGNSSEPGGEVNVYDEGGSVVCTTTVAQDGSWSCTPDIPLDEGEQTYEVTVTDDVGNESDSTPVTLDVDTTVPAAPTVTAPISGTDVMTDTPTFEGTGEAGGEVTITDEGGSTVCTTTVAQDGTWSCTPDNPIDEGEQTYDVTVTDDAGNESDPTPVTLDVDTTVPAAPAVTAPISGTAVMTDTPTFEGTGEAGGEVNVYDDGGSIVCTTTVAQDGSWSCTPSAPLAEGEQTYEVTVTDDAGNESDPTPVTLDVDTTAPAAPTVTSPISGTAVMTDTPTFEGTGEPGGEVTITDEGGSTVCTTTVAQDGSWSCTPSAPLDEGEQTYEVTVTDDAGNESDRTEVTLDVDTTAPDAPTVTSPISGTVTSGTPIFEGTGEAGGEVNVYNEGGSVVCTTTVAQDGTWSCTPSTPLDEGEQTYDVTVTDDAGNESDPTPVTLDVDTTAPSTPAVTSPITGTIVMTDTPTFEGTGEPGGEVTITDEGGNAVCTTTVAQDGAWSCTPDTPLAGGKQTYVVTITDEVGNASAPIHLTLDVDPTATDLAIAQSIQITGMSRVTYTLVAENLGLNPADDAVISDTLTHMNDVAWTCVAAGGAAPATGSGTGDVQHTITTFPVNGVVTCTVTGTLTDWGHVTNTAEIVPPDGIADADEDNNRATVERWQYAFPLVFKNYTP
jgi:hypothetical protein